MAYTGLSEWQETDPATYMIQGTRDGIAPISVTDRRMRALERAGVAAGPRVGRSAEFLEKRGDLRLVLPSGDVVAKEVAQIVKLQLRVVGRHAEEPSERIAFHGRVVGRSRRFDLACEPAVRGAERVGRRERGKDR